MASTSDVSEGPVLTVINKRIRSLRKKLSHITQIENSNKPKNKDQQDLLLSKPSIVAVIKELELLRPQLTVAVIEEKKDGASEKEGKVVEDLLKVIYFGRLFNVKVKNEVYNMMSTRVRERNYCLTYDTVKDDDVAISLNESDLDLLGEMSEFLVSRHADSTHKLALRRCVEHAKKWLAGSDESIGENQSITYAALREKLAKIIGSDYYKIAPEMRALTPEQKSLDQLLNVAARMQCGQSLVSISMDQKIPLPQVRNMAELCIATYRQGSKECELSAATSV